MFSPRIRNLADQRLWHLDDIALPTLAEPLVANRINTGRIVAHWDDLLRLGASIHEGAVLPSRACTRDCVSRGSTTEAARAGRSGCRRGGLP